MGRRKKKKQQMEEESGFSSEELGRPQPLRPAPGLTPVDVQQKVFRLAFRGYNEKDVDEFLDRITEELATLHDENKRLREEVQIGGGGGEGARQHAEEQVRQAREEAARILRDAERRAGLADAASGGTATPAFLVREREFLQSMAALVQDHAGFLKEEARRSSREPTVEPAIEDPSGFEDPADASFEDPADASFEDPADASFEDALDAPSGEGSEEPLAGAIEDDEPAAAPTPPLDATAPMDAVGTGGGVLDEDWSNPFTDDAPLVADQGPIEGGAPAPGAEGFGSEDEEPSLRELFWGDD